jgi:hypothetical protein
VTADREDVWFNGINAVTGGYLQAATSPADIVATLRGRRSVEPNLRELRLRRAKDEPDFGVVFGCDPEILAEAGWGMVAAADTADGVIAALEPLRTRRREQAGDRYYEFMGEAGVQRGESKGDWLRRHGMGPSPANPQKVPYYLLLVGGPEQIGYRFQYQLDVQYAVGRIAFDQTEEYRQYAEAVVRAETSARAGTHRAHLFAPRNPDDGATALSADELMGPMAAELGSTTNGWTVSSTVGVEATKRRLLELVCGAETPDLLFTASHGMGFPIGDPQQREAQGALLCQDWPGPQEWLQAIPENFYLAAKDIGSDRPAAPQVVFAFACFGAGTPQLDDFPHLPDADVEIADEPFVACLPQRLQLNGTLAFIGHVERAWGCSFYWPGVGAQREVFTSTLQALLEGWRVGHAMEFFNARYAELSTELSEMMERIEELREPVEDELVAGMWTANNDARSYAVLGDPAIRIPTTGSAGD